MNYRDFIYFKLPAILKFVFAGLFLPSLIYLLSFVGSKLEDMADKNYYGLDLSQKILLSVSLLGIYGGLIAIHSLFKQVRLKSL